jgi:hypothetical protein
MTEKKAPLDFIEFIIKAKLAGYATGGEDQELIFEDGSKGFEYSEDGFRYVDRYFGFSPFSGYEYVSEDDNALIWTMNYYGGVIPFYKNPVRIYQFLREAMCRITRDFPFRGPATFEKDGFRYENNQTGAIDRFHGIERIFEGKEEVYSLHYHGGSKDSSLHCSS